MGFLEERDFANVPTIPEFYKGKTIFITGGSGFMGKVLIEKLLYSCSDLDRIYLLIRNKKGVKSEDRLAEIYSSQCFDRLKRDKPTIFYSKVFVLAGDVLEIGLGLSDQDRNLLINNVDIVFHVAASVRFDDPLPYAVKMNVRGTKEVVELSRNMNNLSAFVHVSTCYSNTNRDTIEETMYPPLADVEDTLNICESIDEETLRVFTPKFLGEVPNTYAFSKQLAEHVVYGTKGQMPAVIVRPSIVISSVEEPVPGWIENFNGPAGLLAASGKGILRSFYTDPNLIADYMAVDVSIKSLIAAGWIRGTKNLESTDDIPVYNCCTGDLNNMTMGDILDIGREMAKVLPLNSIMWYPGGDITSYKTINYLKVLLQHLMPAIIVDTILKLLGRKPMLVKVQRRIFIASMALEYYTTNQWKFSNKNFVQLRSCIKDEDINSFYYEIEKVDRYQFFFNCIVGARKFLFKETDEDLPKARKHFMRMLILDRVVRCIFLGFLFWWFLNLGYVQDTFNKLSVINV